MQHDSKTPAEFSEIDYHHLMQRRINKILLVSSSYEGFVLEEDGRIDSQITQEYIDLNLSNPPSITRVSSSIEALELLEMQTGFDLIISMYNVGKLDVFSFGKIIRQKYPHIPFVLLTSFSKDMKRKIEAQDRSGIDFTFYWHGNADLIIAIIKTIEDRMNADNDILKIGVQCILLVEDSIRYYSTYLPAIYKIVLQQNSEFIRDALNEQQQIMRKRARPKILLATNYSEAVELYEKYKENMLGVISDVGFVVNKFDKSEDEKLDAGIDLCRLIKKDNPNMPFLLQSSQESMREVARQLGVGFLVKYSKTLLLDLAEYISEEFAFGDFVFKNPHTGMPVCKAKDLKEMQQCLMEIDDEVLAYHASHNHLSKWMFSRGLFPIAAVLRDIRLSDYGSVSAIRKIAWDTIRDYRLQVGQGVVARFDPATYDDSIWFARIGRDSLGGKARGLAFANNLLLKYKLYDKYPGVRITIPRTVVIATDYFDEFIKQNGLQYVINSEISDADLLSEFVSSSLPERLIIKLRAYIKHAKRPLAVRSSSKLEDSDNQPFAGIYSTYMIPLTDNEDQTLRLLGKAIKSVYASIYFAASRAYIATTQNLLSEERMAVIIQEICGSEDGGYFFPTVSGTANSTNFYPIGNEKPQDGIVKMAFGLGKLVVDGGRALRFSPKYPKKVLQLSTPELALHETQKEMYALNLRPEEFKTSIDDAVNLSKFDINDARRFRTMRYVASTWDAQSGRINDTNEGPGRKIITFAHLLKYGTMPIGQIISELLEIGQREMRCPVELEFAINMDVPDGARKIFNLLQIRPTVKTDTGRTRDWADVETADAIVYAQSALGIGRMTGIRDIVYVKNKAFKTTETEKIAQEISAMNARMHDSGGYVLIGPGRWGSSDSFLGIPVRWNHISEARVIVECGLPNFMVEPSQGTHFFQNLTSLGVGYMTVNPFMGDGVCDFAALDAMPSQQETLYLRHVRFDEPLDVFIDGQNNKGIIKK